jgi:hypothetical protein
MKIVATIPARLGSRRLMNGEKPLVWYAIRAALDATTLDEVYVNSESEEIGALGGELGARFYPRPSQLAGDHVTSDELNYDFMKHVEADVVVMVNPLAPLVTGRDIDAMVEHFLAHEIDTLVPVRDETLHAFCDGEALGLDPGEALKRFGGHVPVNFDASGRLPRTQDNAPLRICTWTVCIWRRETFMRAFEQSGAAVFSGRVGFFPQHPIPSIQVSGEEDFRFAEILLRYADLWRYPKVPYDSEAKLGAAAPAMWLAEIEHIERALLDEGRRRGHLCIVEWGSGNGTLHFARFLRERGISFQWDAVENYYPRYFKVAERIQAAGFGEQVKLHLCNGTFEDRDVLQEEADMTEFVELPLHRGCEYDVALVDGRKRGPCLEIAARVLRADGLAILHDAERPEAHGAFHHYHGDGAFVVQSASPVPGGVQKLWVGRPLPR